MIHNLGEQIGTTLAKAEEIGAAGNVEESLKLMSEVEELKKKKAAAEVGAELGRTSQLRVLDVCWCYVPEWT